MTREPAPGDTPAGLPRGVLRILWTAEKIAGRVSAIASEIRAAHGGRTELTIVPVMDGALVFCADLVRQLPMQTRIEPVRAMSYAGTLSTGRVEVSGFPDPARIAGRDVLIIDDILDTGRTMGVVQQRLRDAGARSLRTAVLIERDRARDSGIKADHVGFRLADGFVIGYGLDFNGHYRGLPYVALLDTERVVPR